MNVIHVIVGLNIGGAETALCRLVQSMNFCRHTVISLTDVGPLGLYLRTQGVNVVGLGIQPKQIAIPIFRLTKIIRDLNPDIIQTWMYHADLVGGIAGVMAGVTHIVWGVRNTGIPQGKLSVTYLIIRVAAALSYFIPTTIVCNSEAGKDSHIKIGYKKSKLLVIPNGFDVNILSPIGFNKKNIRLKYNLPKSLFIVGVIARFDLLKGYETMVKVANKFLNNSNQNVIFVFVGKCVDSSNPFFNKSTKILGAGGNVVLLGEQKNIPEIIVAFDILCSPSISEGFPNVVAEAMLMEKPCIVTDVGDSRLIVGDTGVVVPPDNADSIIDSILMFSKMSISERIKLGGMARERIITKYGIQKMVNSFKLVYESNVV